MNCPIFFVTGPCLSIPVASTLVQHPDSSTFNLSTSILSHIRSKMFLPKAWLCLDHCPVQSSMPLTELQGLSWPGSNLPLQPRLPHPALANSLIINRKSQLFSDSIMRVSVPSLGHFPPITSLYPNLPYPPTPRSDTTFFIILTFLILWNRNYFCLPEFYF